MKNILRVSDMEKQLLSVFLNIVGASGNIFTSMWGKITVFGMFIGSLFAPISGLIHLTLILVAMDMLFGISVVVHRKGLRHIMSSRMRDSLVKAFFYLIFLITTFLVETQLVDGYYVTSKVVFAIISGVELLSISANMLILFPNFPFLRIFKTILTKEMSKKLDIEEEELGKILKNKKNDTKTDN